MTDHSYVGFYFGNYPDIDPNESCSGQENIGALQGATASRGGELKVSNITLHDNVYGGSMATNSSPDSWGGGVNGDVLVMESTNLHLAGFDIQTIELQSNMPSTNVGLHALGNFGSLSNTGTFPVYNPNQIADGEVMDVGYNDAGQATDGGLKLPNLKQKKLNLPVMAGLKSFHSLTLETNFGSRI